MRKFLRSLRPQSPYYSSYAPYAPYGVPYGLIIPIFFADFGDEQTVSGQPPYANTPYPPYGCHTQPIEFFQHPTNALPTPPQLEHSGAIHMGSMGPILRGSRHFAFLLNFSRAYGPHGGLARAQGSSLGAHIGLVLHLVQCFWMALNIPVPGLPRVRGCWCQ